MHMNNAKIDCIDRPGRKCGATWGSFSTINSGIHIIKQLTVYGVLASFDLFGQKMTVTNCTDKLSLPLEIHPGTPGVKCS
jgi:hypothetical protein